MKLNGKMLWIAGLVPVLCPGFGFGQARERVDPVVYSEVEMCPEGTPSVIVILKPVDPEVPTPEQKRTVVRETQDKVLAKMAPGEFEVTYRFETAAMLVGHVNAAGLTKLATDPDVVAVSPNKIEPDVFAKLQSSAESTVYVNVTLRAVDPEVPTPEQRAALVRKIQDGVLARMATGEFKIAYRFETVAMMIGHVNAAGLAKFAVDPDVVWVERSRIKPDVFAKLQSSADGTVRVSVQLMLVARGAPTLQEKMALIKEVQDSVLGKLAPGEFKLGSRCFSIGPYLRGHINAAGLAKLATDSDVLAVWVPSLFAEPHLNESVPFIRADQVHGLGYTGAAITVAVLDTGVDCSHPDVQGSCVGGAATFLEGWARGGAEDDVGHGTYMAAIITAENGVAPDAKILPVKVMNASGGGSLGDIADAIRYVVRTKDTHPNLRVINLSFGMGGLLLAACPPCDAFHPEIQDVANALDEAKGAGIVAFASSGMDGDCGRIVVPACVASAVAVTGVYDQTIPFPGVEYGGICQDLAPQPHLVMCISNRATVGCDQLGAPGLDILINQPPPGAPTWGTSHAVAHASGVAALMIEKAGCPGLSPDQIAQIMDITGTEFIIAGISCPGDEVPSSINALDAIDFFTGSCSALGHPACNGDVTLIDFAILIECITGPGQPIIPGQCQCVDYPEGGRDDGDGDVDLRDFAAFQRDFTGWSDGACCHADGSCTDGTPPECFASNGLYQGNGTTCASTDCPLPNWGACCDPDDETCTEGTEEDCVWAWGLYQGHGTTCATTICPTGRYRNTIDPLEVYIPSGSGMRLGDDITLSGGGGGELAFYDLGVYGGGGGDFDVTAGLYTDCPGNGGTLIPGTEFTWLDNYDGASPVFLQASFDPLVTIPHSFWMVVTFSTSQAGWFRAEEAETGFTADLFGRNNPPWVCNYWWGGPPNPYAGFWANIGCVEP
ncbi:MAG: S8 family serine peptidase [Phycisphaerae bacterium]|nr:S8 family serine peptidase [Phycisphaerae bacterium]